MEVFGAVSAVLSLVDIIARSSSAIDSLISDWRDVPAEIVALGTEIDDSKAVLNQVCQILHLLENAPSTQAYGVDSTSTTISIQKLVNRATPIWQELQGYLNRFSERDSKALRYRWLKSQRNIERMRKELKESRRGIQELLALLSV